LEIGRAEITSYDIGKEQESRRETLQAVNAFNAVGVIDKLIPDIHIVRKQCERKRKDVQDGGSN
jgi:hypothetical protein